MWLTWAQVGGPPGTAVGLVSSSQVRPHGVGVSGEHMGLGAGKVIKTGCEVKMDGQG